MAYQSGSDQGDRNFYISMTCCGPTPSLAEFSGAKPEVRMTKIKNLPWSDPEGLAGFGLAGVAFAIGFSQKFLAHANRFGRDLN